MRSFPWLVQSLKMDAVGRYVGMCFRKVASFEVDFVTLGKWIVYSFGSVGSPHHLGTFFNTR